MNCEYYTEPCGCNHRAVYRVYYDTIGKSGFLVRVIKVICQRHIAVYKNLPASCGIELIDSRLEVMK